MLGWSRLARICRSVRKRRRMRLRIHAALDQLDRDLLLILIIGAHGQVDGPHAAVADLACNLVRADTPSCHRYHVDPRRPNRLLISDAGVSRKSDSCSS